MIKLVSGVGNISYDTSTFVLRKGVIALKRPRKFMGNKWVARSHFCGGS